ncbi:MAG TPA: Ig-like domain repeat protein [Candidatus Acidoferrum sp.]|nr:Ig-like domain repeat protein [Candidatus Acidoferrum sp.]
MRTYWTIAFVLLAALALGIPPVALGSVTSTSGNVIFVDTSSNQSPSLLGNYLSFNVTNDTGSAIADAWVKIDSFTGAFVGLATNENGLVHVGPMSAGVTRAVYFYVNVNCSSFSAGNCNVSTAQPFTVRLYSGPPSTTQLGSQSFSVTVQETIAAQSNKVTTVVTSTNSPTLGALVTVTVTGNTGTIGSAKFFYESPETYFDFPASSFRLYSTSTTFSGGNTGTFTDQLLIPSSAFTSTSATDYTFVATYLAVGPTSTPTAVSPVAYISSGTQTKHTGTSGYSSFSPINPTSNTTSLSKLVSAANWPTGGVPTYTLRLTNTGSSTTTLDNLVDTLPNSPANATYVAGSATYAGSPIGDPSISGGILTWNGIFSVPANGTADLTFQATVPPVNGVYTNSAVAHIGTTQIDTTIDTSDNSPATVALSVGSIPDLTIAKSHSGNFTQGQTGATYTITVGNSGTGATSGTVTVTDTLPSGLTATAMSGTGWSCTLGTLTCTRADALAASSSYPAITLTVNVSNTAAASITNTATVAGGGETNTANDSASDVTTVAPFVQATTSTTLAVLPNSPVNPGATITLTATVVHGNTPLSPGVVNFCDANAPQCKGESIFGSAQLTASGTASTNLVLAAGTYSIKAVFTGTSAFQGSESSVQIITVDGGSGYTTTTLITANGSANNYTLTGTVEAFGKPVPIGIVSFLDTTNSNSIVGSASLDPNSLGFTVHTVSTTPAVSGAPTSLVTADFNADGKTDLAVADGSTNSVSVLLGNEDGTFLPEVTYTTDPNGTASAIAVGDFNADGNNDLLITNIASGSSTISILLGNGDGTFQPQVTTPVGNHPSGIVVNEFNGDGDLDVAVANRDDNTVGVLLGNGDGTFQPQVTYAVGNSPVALTSADVNGDGIADLIVANNADNTISVLLGNGDGTFQPQVTYAVGNSPVALTSADVNGDGIADLIVANNADNTISVLLGNGDGTFQPQVTYAVGNSPVALTSADVNGDGIADLIVANNVDNTLSVLLGKGDGTFPAIQSVAVSSGPSALAAGDYNGDGLVDIASLGNVGSGKISVLLSQHTVTATSIGVSLSSPGTHDVLASYPGDNAHAASQSATIPLSGPNLTATTTVLSASPNPATSGQQVTLTATVSPTPTGSPTGTVSFYNGSTLLGTATVNASGVATMTTSSLPVGTNSLSATYSGNTNFATSTSSTLTENVTGAALTATTTILVASPNPATSGQQVTLTATVSPTPTGSPTGTVNFYNGSTLLGTATVNASGVATMTTSSLPVGTNSLSATYSGNTNFATSTSSTLTENVTGAALTATTTILVASPNPATSGQQVTLTATVSPTPTGSPTGTVSFYNGSTLLGTATVNASGVATLTGLNFSPGTAGITAVYSGNASFATSTSPSVNLTVSNAAAYTVTAPQTPYNVTAGKSVDVNVMVSPVGGAYNNLVVMSASGLPPGASATFTPPSVTPGSAGTATVMTIHTAVLTAEIPPQRNPDSPFPFVALASCGLALVSYRKRLGATLASILLVGCLAGGALVLSGCNGGFAGKPATGTHTFVVTITGTSGSLHPSTTITVTLH